MGKHKTWLFPCAVYNNKNEAEALLERLLHLLEQAAAEAPLKIPTVLKELPHDSANLGYCARPERTISLKLRTQDDPTAFLTFGEVLATLCHELAHLQAG